MANAGVDTANFIAIAVAAAPPLRADVVDRLRSLLGPKPDDLGASITQLPLSTLDTAPLSRAA